MKHPQQEMPSDFLWNMASVVDGSESNPAWWALPLAGTKSKHSRQASPELQETEHKATKENPHLKAPDGLLRAPVERDVLWGALLPQN